MGKQYALMMTNSTQRIFQQCEISTDGVLYVLIKLPLDSLAQLNLLLSAENQTFLTIMRDKHEVTLLISQEMWDTMRDTMPSAETAGAFRLNHL